MLWKWASVYVWHLRFKLYTPSMDLIYDCQAKLDIQSTNMFLTGQWKKFFPTFPGELWRTKGSWRRWRRRRRCWGVNFCDVSWNFNGFTNLRDRMFCSTPLLKPFPSNFWSGSIYTSLLDQGATWIHPDRIPITLYAVYSIPELLFIFVKLRTQTCKYIYTSTFVLK